MRASANASIAIASALLIAAAFAAGCRTAAGTASGPAGGPAGGGRGGGKPVALATPPALHKTVTSLEASEIAALPEGQAKTLVTERCLLCHGAGLITAQHKDAAAWGRTVTQMRTWGTPIQDDDQTAIVAYLTQHYGKKP
jgi:cytochrome c5